MTPPISRRSWLRRSASALGAAALAPVAACAATPAAARPLVVPPAGPLASVTDFASLKANVYAFDARNGDQSLRLHETLGDYDRALARVGAGTPAGEQLANGLYRSAVESVALKERFLDVPHDLMLRQRVALSEAIYRQHVPAVRLHYLEPVLEDPGAFETWLDTLPWHDPWSCGNLTMDSAWALAVAWKLHGDDRARQALDVWFDWHDRHADPETGFWDPRVVGSLHRAMAGAVHQYGIYWLLGRETPYPEEAMRATMRLQNGFGLFTPEYPSHHSSDVDAVFLLANLYNRYGILEAEVKASLERALAATLRLFHPEGGGINRYGVDTEPDGWATWVRTASVGWCSRVLGVEAFAGPWELDSHRHPFVSEDADAGVPDPSSPEWFDAVPWPRPA